MAAGWRLYARRTVTGEWLHTDVPAVAAFTWAMSGAGAAKLSIPAALDVETAADGDPLWLERGTTLYAEQDGLLKWVGLCDYVQTTGEGRTVDLKGLTSVLGLIAYDGVVYRWDADPFSLVAELVDNAQAQPNGDVGLRVVRDGRPPDMAGDKKPPDAPTRPKRRKGETRERFETRLAEWAEERDDWEKLYGDREAYRLGWWDHVYVGDEIDELAEETGFEWHEVHRWTDRAELEARHELVLHPPRSVRRQDVALVEGQNVADVVEPETNLDAYGNHVVALGSGEGRAMKRAVYGRRDNRVRTTRFVEAKHVKAVKRLRRRAQRAFGRASARTVLEGLTVSDATAGVLEVGDVVQVRARTFEGWLRVVAITRSTDGAPAALAFDTGSR